MKTYLAILALMFTAQACAMGSPRPDYYRERRAEKKLWRPCQAGETEAPVGKLCNHHCLERKDGKCKKWKTSVKDFAAEFSFFRDGSFIMIDEDSL